MSCNVLSSTAKVSLDPSQRLVWGASSQASAFSKFLLICNSMTGTTVSPAHIFRCKLGGLFRGGAARASESTADTRAQVQQRRQDSSVPASYQWQSCDSSSPWLPNFCYPFPALSPLLLSLRIASRQTWNLNMKQLLGQAVTHTVGQTSRWWWWRREEARRNCIGSPTMVKPRPTH